jgi:hypothetical protein
VFVYSTVVYGKLDPILDDYSKCTDDYYETPLFVPVRKKTVPVRNGTGNVPSTTVLLVSSGTVTFIDRVGRFCFIKFVPGTVP